MNGHPAPQLFGPAGLDIEAVDGMIISSVGAAHRFHPGLHGGPIFYEGHVRRPPAHHDLGLTPSATTTPYEVGADRLVNGVAGFYKYGGPWRGRISAPPSTST